MYADSQSCEGRHNSLRRMVALALLATIFLLPQTIAIEDEDVQNWFDGAASWKTSTEVVDAVAVLRMTGLGVNVKDDDGNTALHKAAVRGNRIDVIRALADYGIDLNAENNDGNTALHKAASRGKISIIRALAELGADMNAKNERRNSPLYIAAMTGNLPVISVLMELGADVNVKDNDGSTALHKAAKAGKIDVIAALATVRSRLLSPSPCPLLAAALPSTPNVFHTGRRKYERRR